MSAHGAAIADIAVTLPFARIEEPSRKARDDHRFVLWQLGFRPLYLLASIFASLSIAIWALQFAGVLPYAYLQGPLWHAHEMLFGFALAVVVGFLLTAGRNWTNRPTLTGAGLVALCSLWLAGRILVLTPFALAAAITSAAFPLAAAAALAVPFIAARNRRNYFFIGLLVLMSIADMLFHLAQAGRVNLPARIGIQAGLDVVLFIMTVMGGRVIPMFTNNGVAGAAARRNPTLEKFVLGSTLAVLILDALPAPQTAIAIVLGTACAAHFARWILWQPWKTLRTPIVWVLHLAYLWIAIHLGLRTMATLGWLSPSLATHALTVGAIGGLIMGMITRTARGHTGRPLRAGRSEVASYVLIALSAAVRVLVPWIAPGHAAIAAIMSAAMWSTAFGIYAITYWPVLTRPRLDGQPG